MRRTRHRPWYASVVLGLFVAALSLILVTGCSKNPVTSSKVDTQAKLDWLNQNFGEAGPSLAPGISLANCTILYDTTIVQVVNQYGYQMDVIHGGERLGFSLPYMAVSRSVTLTLHVTEYRAPFGKFWVLDCGPTGQKFTNPLYVQPNAAARNGSVVVLFYYDPSSKTWTVQEADQVPPGSNPQIPIYHFSMYAIS